MMKQIYGLEKYDSKTVERIVTRTSKSGEQQGIVEFTDNTFICFTARLDGGRAWLTTQVMAKDYEGENS